ncbi:hypothetical protein [Amycolatopsis sp. NPDC051128]|uniref:hypothetical protein n=1 Tax=Amycolatopsis sp. NPDC051128 TaxID=3155412 RepID=UPI003434491E
MQEIGERDTLRGAVGAERLGGGVVGGVGVRRGPQRRGEQELDVPPVLGRRQPRDSGRLAPRGLDQLVEHGLVRGHRVQHLLEQR